MTYIPRHCEPYRIVFLPPAFYQDQGVENLAVEQFIPPRSMDWLIKRLIKVGPRVSLHARRWQVHVASAFPLPHHYRKVLA